ncbi:MAG: ligand-binding SRPBCC domain-containing protein [Candidatus Binatia bacterium]|jgi:ligand-binding SRPBCC domain-containing protein
MSRNSCQFSIESTLAVTPSRLWEHSTNPDGINREFRPLLTMTFPEATLAITENWQPGKRLFRSWMLLGGFLPVEYDDIALVEVDPGRRFLERSEMFSQSIWEHERTIEPVDGGALLRDRLHFRPRIAVLGPAYGWIFKLVFRVRHRNLRRLFGSL